MSDRVPERVHWPELRAPGTDGDGVPTPCARRAARRRLSGRVAALCFLALAAGVALGWLLGGVR